MTIAVGSPAPSFEKESHDGSWVRLAAGQERDKVMVLYFYPRDETSGCTAQACSFRDQFADFVDAGAEVVGVSPDSLESHRAFAKHHKLPYRLLSDADGELRRAFDVGKTLGFLPGRVTFVIDRSGIVQHVFNSQLQARKHVEEALSVVSRLAGSR